MTASRATEEAPHRGLSDPVICANLYASGRLDEAMLRVLVPLRNALDEEEGEALLWAMRYARNGEHLKIRLHRPPDESDGVRGHLDRLAQDFFATLDPPSPEAERHMRQDAPMIDGKDFDEEPAPDRSLDFTEYQVTKISFGGEPYLGDPAYRGLMVRAFDRGCSLALADLTHHGAVLDHARRHRLMLRAVVQAAYSLGLSPQQTATYAAYHRDWLLRAPLLQSGNDEERAQAFLNDLERLEKRSAAILEVLRESFEGDGPTEPIADTAWGETLVHIAQHVDGRYDGSGIRLDPFAAQPYFPPLIKVLHGFANLIGLKRIDEAFALHLILRAAAQDPEPFRRIHLTPP